jgi:hypothetical protein
MLDQANVVKRRMTMIAVYMHFVHGYYYVTLGNHHKLPEFGVMLKLKPGLPLLQ